MPLYEFWCPRCQTERSMTMTVKEREGGSPQCPDCRARLEPVMTTFFSKTSRKS
jgi:putative FmdB family regulatory protein